MTPTLTQPVSLKNLGRKGLFSVRFLFVLVLVSILVAVLFELLVAKTPWPVFLLRVGFGTIFISMFLYIYGRLADRFIENDSLKALITGIAVFIAGAFRAYSMNYLEFLVFGSQSVTNPYRPLLAGAGFYFGFACIALVNGIRKDYAANAIRFAELKSEIEEFKLAAEKRITGESKKLRRKAQDALLPLLARLEALLAEADTTELAQELRNLLADKIRPLSQRFAKQEDLRINLKRITITKPKAFASIPARFTINAAIYPSLAAVLVGPTLLAVAIYIFGIGSVFPYVLVLGISWLIGKGLSRALPDKPLNTMLVVLVAAVYSSALWGAMLLVLSLIMTGEAPAPQVIISIVTPAVLFSLTLILVSFFAGNVQANVSQTEKLVREYEIYRSYVNQKLWIARRNWSYVIHGTVQSSVTLAITRMAGASKKPTKKMLEALRHDLQVAKAAIDRDLNTVVDLVASIRALEETWQGVCSVSVEICEELNEIANTPSELNFGLNELLKEMVSNAFRHGKATKIEIRLSTPEDKVIRIEAVNDGLPVPDDFNTNVGVAMYKELGVNWSIKSPNQMRGAVLVVDVAR